GYRGSPDRRISPGPGPPRCHTRPPHTPAPDAAHPARCGRGGTRSSMPRSSGRAAVPGTLLGRPSSGAAFTGCAVAPRRQQGLVEKVPLVRAALLPLHAHRKVQAAPCLSNSALRTFARATMASADLAPSVGYRSRPPAPVARRNGEISRGKTLILHSIAAGFTVAVSAWLSGVPIPRRVTQPHRPRIRFL